MHKIKNINGVVNYIYRTGNDLVKSTMCINSVQKIVQSGKSVNSDIPGYGLCIDSLWYFETYEITEEPKTSPATRKGYGKKR